MHKSSIWPQIFAATVASLTLICAGIHYTWPIVESIQPFESASSDWIHQIAWTIILLYIGCFCGLLQGLTLVDKLSRKKTLLLVSIPLIASYVIIIFARSFVLFHLARFIAGIGFGAALVVTPMYIGEIADQRIRGVLCVLISVMFDVGRLLSMAIGVRVSPAALGIVGAVVPIIFATAFIWSTESLYYFAIKNLPQEVQKSVSWLRGPPDVVQDADQIQNSTALNQSKPTDISTLFRALLTIIGLFLSEQASSLTISSCQLYFMMTSSHNYIESYSTVNIISVSLSLITCICVVFLVDKSGRRPLLLASAMLSTFISLVAVSYHLLLVNGIDVEALWFLPIILLSGYSISFSIGIGTLPFFLVGEIFSSEMKNLALGITFTVHFVAGLIVSYLNLIGATGIYIPLVLNIVSGVFIYFAVPETKGRSLSEIQSALQGYITRQI